MRRGPKPLDAATTGWAKGARRISAKTLEAMPVAAGTAYFPASECEYEAIFFRYPQGGWKARALDAKDFVASKGFVTAFWNLEAVLAAAPRRVYIVEGELDALALVEAGIPPGQVLSVPTGARSRQAGKPVDREALEQGYTYVFDGLEAGLAKVRQFVLCTDADAPGLTLRADLAHILGVARALFVDWPEGVKDANDMLGTDGPQALRDLVEQGCQDWPVDGLYLMADLPEEAPLSQWHPGFASWDRKVWLAPRTCSVVTGHPGHGKTALFQELWFNIARHYDERVAICSFETQAKPHIRRYLRTFFHGRLERALGDADMAAADRWIADHYLFMRHPNQRPTLKWFLDMAEVAVVRHGARIVQVDPWNRLESQRGAHQNETDYIGECLKDVFAFSRDLNCHVQILAHPAKMDGRRKGEAPLLDDISGSKNWDNMIDQGFTVHRPQMVRKDGTRATEVDVYMRKARFEELGFPCILPMEYSLKTGCFIERGTDGEAMML